MAKKPAKKKIDQREFVLLWQTSTVKEVSETLGIDEPIVRYNAKRLMELGVPLRALKNHSPSQLREINELIEIAKSHV